MNEAAPGAARRVVLVTGADGNIGRAVSARLTEDGWSVVPTTLHGGSGTIAADLSDFDEASRVVDGTLATYGRIDAIVLAAGLTKSGLISEQEVTDWWAVIDSTLTSAFQTVRAAVGALARSSGTIVLVSCECGVAGEEGATALSAASAGLIGLNKALAREFGPQILTACVAPGRLVVGESRDRQSEAVVASPTPAVVADTVSWILGRRHLSLLGQTIHLNGGSTLV